MMDLCPYKIGYMCAHTPELILASRCISCPWLVNNPYDAFGRSYGYRLDLKTPAKNTHYPCMTLTIKGTPTKKRPDSVTRGPCCFSAVTSEVRGVRP